MVKFCMSDMVEITISISPKYQGGDSTVKRGQRSWISSLAQYVLFLIILIDLQNPASSQEKSTPPVVFYLDNNRVMSYCHQISN